VSSNPDCTPEDDPALRDALKRCSPATYYAACKFKSFGQSEDLRTVILGVIERFVDRELRAKLVDASDTLRLREDLGLDSLTMMEVVMVAEEVVRISVSNEELTQLRTLGDVYRFILTKTAASDAESRAPKPKANFGGWDLATLSNEVRDIEAGAARPTPRASN
jgi:acyl carrier protein